MKILILDNYDSFTYNLAHMVEYIVNKPPDVFRNNQISLDDIEIYDIILLSPGPGIPDEAGILKEAIRVYAGKKPIFGVCLGLQAIVEVFGGSLVNMSQVYHGVSTPIYILDKSSIAFQGIQSPFYAARYHSWMISKKKILEEFKITAEDKFGIIMGMEHKWHPLIAVQFHPESILTPCGEKIICNFIGYAETFIKNSK